MARSRTGCGTRLAAGARPQSLPVWAAAASGIALFVTAGLVAAWGHLMSHVCRTALPRPPEEWSGRGRWAGALARADADPAAARRVFLPDPACPNFLVVTSDSGGVGHRMGAIAFGVAAAEAAGAAVVLDDDLWEAPRGEGESLTFLRTLLSLDAFLSARELGIDLTRDADVDKGLVPTPSSWRADFRSPTFSSRWGRLTAAPPATAQAAARLARSACHSIQRVRTGSGAGCSFPDSGDSGWCFEAFHGGYEAARPVLRALFARSEYARRPLMRFLAGARDGRSRDGRIAIRGNEAQAGVDGVRPSFFTVAWHVRNGDVRLASGGGARFRRLVDAVTSVLSRAAFSFPVRHYVVTEKALHRDDPDFGVFFPLLEDTAPGGGGGGDAGSDGVLWDMAPDEAFIHLAGADLLIHTGSSFAVAAAAVADPSQAFVYSPPKESRRTGQDWATDDAYKVYRLEGCVAAAPDGSINEAGLDTLLTRVRERAKAVGLA
jgi:hypothetical protein